MTTNNATGLFFKKILPSTNTANALRPIAIEAGLVWFKCWKNQALLSQKSSCAPWKPNSFGSCVLARQRATPHLKPVMTLSEMKFTIAPAFTSQAINAMMATNSAVPAARAPKRLVSPFAISPSEAPINNEMAEVMVTTVWRELQKIQKEQAGEQAGVQACLGRQVCE
jgi:hypothetical protein